MSHYFTVETIKSADARRNCGSVAQVMRARFMIGALFRAKAKISDLDQVRAEVGSYIAYGATKVIVVYSQMLKISEPSGTLADSMLFQAAQLEAIKIGSGSAPEEKNDDSKDDADEEELELPVNSWPFRNHNSYTITNEEESTESQRPSQHAS